MSLRDDHTRAELLRRGDLLQQFDGATRAWAQTADVETLAAFLSTAPRCVRVNGKVSHLAGPGWGDLPYAERHKIQTEDPARADALRAEADAARTGDWESIAAPRVAAAPPALPRAPAPATTARAAAPAPAVASATAVPSKPAPAPMPSAPTAKALATAKPLEHGASPAAVAEHFRKLRAAESNPAVQFGHAVMEAHRFDREVQRHESRPGRFVSHTWSSGLANALSLVLEWPSASAAPADVQWARGRADKILESGPALDAAATERLTAALARRRGRPEFQGRTPPSGATSGARGNGAGGAA